MPLADVMQSFGDALSGTDREAAYRKGMSERATIDHTEAQTEAALQLARERRFQAEKLERQRAAEEALREQEATLNDPTQVSGVDVMAAGFGDEYSGLQTGRGRAQEYNLRETIAQPSAGMGLGDELDPATAHEYEREAALEALSPSAALGSRRMDPTLVPVLQPDGSSIYMPRPDAPGQTVGGPPSRAAGGAGNPGGLRTADSSLIYRQASALFGGTYDPTTGRFASLDRDAAANVQRIASRAAVIFKAGGIDHATAVDQALDEMRAAAQTPGGTIAPQFGDALGDEPAAGTEDIDPSTGQPWEATDASGNTVIYRNGQWVPKQ
jgi:hypothetical protein